MIAKYRKNGKRIVSFVMAMVMMFSLLPVQAFATETGEGEDHVHCEVCGEHECVCCEVCGQAECVCPEEETPVEDEPVEEPAPTGESEALVALRAEIVAYIEELGLTPGMSDQMLLYAYGNHESLEAAQASLTAQDEFRQRAAQLLTKEEKQILLAEENSQLCIRYREVVAKAYATEEVSLTNQTVIGKVTVTTSGDGSSSFKDGTLTVPVTGGKSGCDDVTGTANVTFTNGYSMPITLSFTAKIDGGSGVTGNKSVELKAGESMAYSVTTDGKGSSAKATLTINSFSVAGKGTFGAVQGDGSYTLSVNNGATQTITTDKVERADDAFGTEYTLTAILPEGSVFQGWFDENGDFIGKDNPYTFEKEGHFTVYPKFAKPSVKVEFAAAENGTYKVGEEEATSGLTKEEDVNTTYTAEVTSVAEGYIFFGWYDVTNSKYIGHEKTLKYVSVDDVTLKPEFMKPDGLAKFGVGSETFYNLNAADAAAKGATITLLNDGVLPAADYTISSGNTLLIPMEDGKVYTTEPKTYDKEDYGYVAPTAFRKLQMADGAEITVNGSLSIAGSQRAGGAGMILDDTYREIMGGVHGPVGFIEMDAGSKITVNGGGNLYAWGYITGSGSVEVMRNGTVYESFQVTDWRGGSAASDIVDNKWGIFPMSQYYVQNIEVPMKLNAGAIESGYTSTTITLVGVVGAPVPFVGNGGLFSIDSGYLLKDYDEASDRQVYEVHGNVSMDKISIEMQVSIIKTVRVDSSKYALPITCNLTVDVVSGTINITQDLAFLPGSEIIVQQGAYCNLSNGKSVYVYDRDEWAGYCSNHNMTHCPLAFAPGRTGTRAALADANIQIDGTVNADAGFLYTTTSGAKVFSTGTGKVNMKLGTATTTYQYTQGESCTKVDIPVVVAKLQNGDHTEENPSTTNPATEVNPTGTTYTYTNGVWVPSCNGNACVQAEGLKDCQDKVCKYCGALFERATAAHTPGAAATCTTAQTCTKCGTELNAALGHSEETVPGTAATCYSTGLTEGVKCNRAGCGAILTAQTVTDKTAHTWGSSPIASTEPTCTTDGSKTYECTVCRQAATQGKFDASAIGTKTEPVITSGHNAEKGTDCKDSTCIATGIKDYWYCSKCATYYSDAACTAPITENIATWKTGNGVIAKKAHATDNEQTAAEVPSTCTVQGTMAYWYCSTCTTYYSDAACNRKIDDIDAWKNGDGKLTLADHELQAVTEQAATCLAPGHNYHSACKNCDATQNKIVYDQLSHVGTVVAAKAPTCTVPGHKEYYKCNNGCGKYYSTKGDDGVLSNEITPAEWYGEGGAGNIPALGHHLVLVPEVPKTCTTDGTAAHYVCVADDACTQGDCDGRTVYCGKLFRDAAGEELVTETDLVIKASHTPAEAVIVNEDDQRGTYELVVYCSVETCKEELSRKLVAASDPEHIGVVQVAYKAATCTEDGNSAGWKCTDVSCPVDGCGGTATNVETINKLGHTFAGAAENAITYTFDKTALTCTASGICTRENCGAEHSVTVDATMTEVPLTCESNHTKTYTASFGGYEGLKATHEETDTIEVTTGHDWSGEVTYTDLVDAETCTATHTCGKNFGLESCVRTATATVSKVVTPPTCTAAGYTTYTADFTEDWTVDQTKKVDGEAATGHTYTVSENTVAWNANATSATCKATLNCKDRTHYIANVAAVVTKDHTPATCEEDGKVIYTATFVVPEGTEGKMADDQQPLTHEVTLSALNHDWEYSYDWSDDNAACTATRVCKNDSSHTNTETAEAVYTCTATCVAAGKDIYTVTFRNENGEGFATEPAEVAREKLGHDPVKVEAKASTCAEKGVQGNNEYYTCSRCSGVFEDEACTVSTTVKMQTLPYVGHKFTNYVYDNNRTCEKDGTKTALCDYGCGTKSEPIVDSTHPRSGHTYDDGVITTPPTCTEEGVRTFTCQNDWCDVTGGHAYTEHVEALGHSLIAHAGKESTCDDNGYSAYYQCTPSKARSGERSYCGYYFAAETDTAVDATPIAKNTDELTAWQTKSVAEGGGQLALRGCVDADKNHECDYEDCDKSVGTHADANRDHKCDAYGVACAKGTIGTHVENKQDTQHRCDYCGVVMGTHSFTNGICTCTYVQDLTVTITIKAVGYNDFTLATETIKYQNNGTDFTKTLNLSNYGDCVVINSVEAKVGETDVGHSWTEDTVTVGYEALTGDVNIVVNAQQTHIAERAEVDRTEATCLKDGKEVISLYCSKCHQLYSTLENVIPAKGEHTYDEGVYTEPTFDADGYTTYTCQYDQCDTAGGHIKTETATGTKLIAVAKVGTQRFETLEEAIEAVGNRGTITLLSKYTIEDTEVWDLGKRVTLYVPAVEDNYGLIVKGDLTIKSGTYVVEGMYGIGVTGKLTIDGGTFEVEENNDYLIGSWGTTVINGGEFVGQYNCVNGFAGSLTITGGTFETADKDATGEWDSYDVLAEDGVATITGGTFSKSVAEYVPETHTEVNRGSYYEVTTHKAGESQKENVVPATCTEPGSYDEVTRCVDCGEVLKRETGKVIPAAGHTVTVIDGKTATCTEPGYKEAYYCSVCEKYFATRSAENEKVLSDEITVELSVWQTEGEGKVVKPHNGYLISATAMTCVSDGNNAYYKCSVCLQAFVDEDCQTPTTDAEQIVYAVPHAYGEGKYLTENDKPTCTKSGTLTYTCQNTWCNVEGGHTYTVAVDKLNHDYDWEGGKVVTEPTCTADGYTTYDCSRCDETHTGDKVSKTGHTKEPEAILGQSPTCTENGWKNYYQCQNSCGLYYEDASWTKLIGDAAALEVWKTTGNGVKPAWDHKYTAVDGKAPDCTNPGYLASFKCTNLNCFQYFTEDEDGEKVLIGGQSQYNAWVAEGGDGYIKANGHTPGEVKTENVVAPKCEENGSHDEVTYCTVCQTETSRVNEVDNMTGHTGERVVEATAPTCTDTGLTEGKYCDACEKWTEPQAVVDAKGHTVVETAEVAPKCNAFGTKAYYYCETCELYFATKVSDTELSDKIGNATELTQWLSVVGQGKIAKLPHTEVIDEDVPATCEGTGLTEGKHCDVCEHVIKEQEVVPATGHTQVSTIEQVDATCKDFGVKEYYFCDACDKYFATKVSDTELSDEITDLDAWKSGDGKIAKLDHKPEIIPAVAPSCTEDGLTSGLKCSVCQTVLNEPVKDPAKGHKPVADKAVDPTCTETGLTEGSHCSVCQTVLDEQEPVDALGHTIEATAEVAAKCNAFGTKAYYYCETCELYFATKVSDTELSDKIGNATELTQWLSVVGQGKIAKLPHTEEIDAYQAPTCTETGLTEGKHCKVCGHVIKAQDTIPDNGHTETIDAAKAATCTEPGLTEGKHCSVCQEILIEQETVEALGHSGELVKGQPAKCEQAGWKDYYQCKTCKKYFVEADCTQPIADLNAWRTTGDGVIADLEHKWDEGRVTTLPTCTEEGVRTFTCSTCNGTKTGPEEALGHDVEYHEGKAPTYTSPGWEPYETCKRCDEYNTLVAIPALGEPEITNFDDFIENLAILEAIADYYVKKVAPGNDPAMLVIKYIRTGVDRYNSGSWNIMAGYEDADFADYVRKYEEEYNASLEEGEEMMKVSGLKNIHEFYLPNGDWADIGHVFGSMDITYTNKSSEDHADVSGWAGDTVDLMSMVDQFGWESTNLEDMIEEINTKYFLKYREDFEEEPIEGTFSNTDMEGDLDAFYVMQQLYSSEYGNGTLTEIFSEYMTASLTSKDRAAFFLNNRLDGVSLRSDVRDAVYNEYLGNGVVATLEGTRPFNTTDLTDLRKACCYVVADYLCRLAGDFIEVEENIYFNVYQTETATLAPGIVQKINYANTADGRTMVYYLAIGDITQGNVHIYANYNNNDPAAGWEMQRVLDQANAAQNKYGDPESGQYIENYNVIASINGAGYDMYTGEPSGILVMDGVTYHPIDSHGFFGILDDGTARIGTMAEFEALQAERPGRVREAIATFGDLIRDGKIVAAEGGDRAGRTAIGITATGKVVFMVLDGRQGALSAGGNMREIAQIMLEAGCVTAVNLDGGGSTTYVAREPGATELSVVNSPSDGAARSVSTSLLMVSTAPDSTAFDRAVIDSEYAYFTVGSGDTFTATAVGATGNVVDMPEGVEWAVSNEEVGSITADGVFTAKANGDATVQLKLDGAVVGSKNIHVVYPDNVYFAKSTINAIYGEPITLPVRVSYEGKAVAFNEADVVLSVADPKHGAVEGFTFTGNEESGLRNIKVTAALICDPSVTGSIDLAMYTKDEASFDFENASGGDQQLAWIREVTNSTLEGSNVYRSIDREQPMVTSYTFAMDMSKITMPTQLEDLTYMLPGADVEGSNTAWSFLLQLAERVSTLTEVTPILYFDKDLEVDYSELTINNEYFYLKEAIFNEEENSLTLVMKWHRQEKPIDIDAANPMCIVTGITLTPKEDAAWNSSDALAVVNKGMIAYDIYLRANALYSFSSKPENQEVYGLYPFTNIREDGVTENGGHFQSVYKDFEDQYTLSNGVKDGWVVEGGGFAYYENGEKYVGIQKIDGYYYDFGDQGVNIGQKKYTGDMTDENGNEFYLVDGVVYTGWMVQGIKRVRYYNPETGIREQLTEDEVPSTCIIDGHCVYTSESGAQKRIDYDDAGGHEYVRQADGSYVCSVCDYVRIEMEDVTVTLSTYAYTYNGQTRTPSTIATAADGRVLTKPGQTAKYDYYSTYTNNVDVGTASVTLTAMKYGKYSNLNTWRGNAAGTKMVTYEIRPDLPTDITMEVVDNKAVLSWKASLAPDVTYVIYVLEGENWTELAQTTELSYSMDVAETIGKYFRIGTYKVVDDATYESIKKTKIVSLVTTAPLVAVGSDADGKPTLRWTGVTDVNEYKVYRATKKSGYYANVFTTTGKSYVHVSAVAENTYYYFVRAILSDGTTVDSEIVTNRPLDSDVEFTITTGNSAEGKPTLKWTAIADADYYEVYRAETQDGSYSKMFTTKGTSYANTSAIAGKTYYYKLKVVLTDETEVVSDIIQNTCIIPDVVFDITPGNNTEGKPTLKWKPIIGADYYEVYRANTRNGNYVKAFTTKGTTYANISATTGKTYYYKLKVVLTDGTEEVSDIIQNTCIIPDVVFDITPGNNAEGKPTLKWTAIAGADHYEVYRANTRNGNYIKAFTTKGTTYTNISATAGKTYYYKLKVVLTDGTEVVSDILQNTCLISEVVFDIKTGNNAEGKPTLKWTAIAGADHYEVYRANTRNGNYIKAFTTKGITYTNISATAGKTYYYKLMVHLVDGTTETSEIITNKCLRVSN